MTLTPRLPNPAELYRLLTEELCDHAIFVTDPDGLITTWNPGVESILGYSREEFIGQPFAMLFTPEDREKRVPESEMQAAQHHGRAPEARLHQHKDGSLIHVEGVLDAVKSPGGELLGFTKLMRNVTRQKRAEQEHQELIQTLAQRAAELEAILGSLPDALYIGDLHGITRVNRLALEQLGFETEEALRADVPHLAERIQTRDPRTGQRLRPEEEPFVRALNGETVAREVATTHLVSGAEVIVRCSARPIRLEDRILGAVAINTDITAEKRAEAERERLLGELERSNEELSQFAHIVSHDLQAPIRMIKSFSELLARHYKSKLDQRADEFIAIIQTGVSSMEQLVRSLLNYSVIGKQSMAIAPVPLEGTLDAALTLLQPVIREAEAEVFSRRLPTVEADPVLVQQLFQNLIGNAVKYSRPGVSPRIEVTAEERDREWLLSVADNGIGIEPTYHAHVFAPLKRLHGSEIPGTGIGLAVCRRIVEHHGGRIWLESEPGVGSTFYFTLPR